MSRMLSHRCRAFVGCFMAFTGLVIIIAVEDVSIFYLYMY